MFYLIEVNQGSTAADLAWIRKRGHLRNVTDLATGSWRNVINPSYRLSGITPAQAVTLATLADQECLLAVDDNNQATLHYPDGRIAPAGRWCRVPEEEARAQEAWTCINHHYYICKEV